MSAMGRVYFARANDRIKIGWSSNVDGRMKALQTGASAPLEVIGTFRGTREVEAALHRRFASLRAHGEWFDATPELLALIPWLCCGAEQRAAEDASCLEILRSILIDACNELYLLSRDVPEYGLASHVMESVYSAVSAAVEDVETQVKTCRWETAARVARLGQFAREPALCPERPTRAAVQRFGSENGATSKAAQAARDACPADYLSLVSIFDEEFPRSNNERAADARWTRDRDRAAHEARMARWASAPKDADIAQETLDALANLGAA